MFDKENEMSLRNTIGNTSPTFGITQISSDYGQPDITNGGSIARGLVYIQGTAPPNSQVILQLEGQKPVVLRADNEGNWSRLLTTGTEGEKTFKATASTAAGWVVEERNVNVIAAAPQPEHPAKPAPEPEPETPARPAPETEIPVRPAPEPLPEAPIFAITKISSGFHEENLLESGSIGHGLIYIRGTATPYAQIILQIEGQKTVVVRADHEGNWSQLTTTGAEGEKTIKATVSTSAGWLNEEYKINVTAAAPPIDLPDEPALEPERPVTPEPEIPVQPEPERPVVPAPEKPAQPEPERPVVPEPGDGSVAPVFTITKISSGFHEENLLESGRIKHGLIYIGGTAPPYAQIILQIEGKKTVVVRADHEGKWSQLTTTGAEGEKAIKAMVVTSAGWLIEEYKINVTTAAPPTELPDEPAPEPKPETPEVPQPESKVVINAVFNRDGVVDSNTTSAQGLLTLKGVGPANSVVDIYSVVRGLERTIIDSVTTKDDGSWSITISLPPGANTITAQNNDLISQPFEVNIDVPYRTEHKVEIISVWTDEGTGGQLINGAYTEDSTPKIIGTAAPDKLVYIVIDGQTQPPVLTNRYGDWQFTPTLHEGRNEITVISGNTDTEPFVIILPGEYVVGPSPQPEPEIPEILSGFADEGQMGGINNGDTTQDRTPYLDGKAAPNAEVQIFLNGQPTETVFADRQGFWNYTPTLSYGENVLTAVVNGLESQPFVIHFEPLLVPAEPIVTIEGRNEGFSDTRTSSFGGRAPALNIVTIYADDRIIGSVQADTNGFWHFNTALNNGENVIKASVEGEFSQQKTITVTGTPAPNITSFQDDYLQGSFVNHSGNLDDVTPRLTGVASPDAVVHIWLNTQHVGSALANINGVWFYDLSLESGRNDIYVVDDGVSSETFIANLQDAPTITGIYANGDELIENGGDTINAATITVRGTAQPLAEVFLEFTGGRTLYVQADSEGNWNRDIVVNNGSTTVYVLSDGQWSMGYEFNYIAQNLMISPVNEEVIDLSLVAALTMTDPLSEPFAPADAPAIAEAFMLSAFNILAGNDNALFAAEPVHLPQQTLSLKISDADMQLETLHEGITVENHNVQVTSELDELTLQA